MTKLLVVDDEEMIRSVIAEYARFENYECDEAADGMEAVAKAVENNYDVIIMDVMMPRLDGFSAVKEIRKKKDTPIIMLSARVEEYDKLFGFEMGVDDYVTKPFSPKEVMARVNAILKRGKISKGKIVSDGLVIDKAGRNVYVDGVKAEMTPKEYELLFFLADNAGLAI